MVLDIKTQLERYNIAPKGIIQVGSHYAEEISDFDKLGVSDLILIEPLPEAFAEMQRRICERPNTTMYNVALGNTEGTAKMNVETINEGQSSSLLKPTLHLKHYPHIQFNSEVEVPITKLDSLKFDSSLFNGIVIDVQGFELDVMKGATETLKHIDWIYSEVNVEPLYENCTLLPELDAYLAEFGFIRVECSLWGDAQSFGDAIYIKTDVAYSNEVSTEPEFSEEAYLFYHPDVAQAVREFKFSSGLHHYEQYGKNEGRKWYSAVSSSVLIPAHFQQIQNIEYPQGNKVPFERWFHNWTEKNLPATNRILLPIYWTSYYVNNEYGGNKKAIAELQELINKLDKTKQYYTIVQYDDGILNDLSGLDILVFSMGSNKAGYYPISLSSEAVKVESVDYEAKNILYSFTGAETHPIRRELYNLFGKHAPISLKSGDRESFINQMKQSIFALCPRGYGVTSFRIAEALQYGCIPVYISDEFWEPFNMPFTEYGIKVHSSELHLLADILAKADINKLRYNAFSYFRNYYLFESMATNIVKLLM